MEIRYPVTAYLAPGVLGTQVETGWGTTVNQVESARVIERQAQRAGLPPEIAAAMIVNAMQESYLDPLARGDMSTDLLALYRRAYPGNRKAIRLYERIRPPRPMSLGLFQLYEQGHGKEMVRHADPNDPSSRIVWDVRQDPVLNTQSIIREAVRRRARGGTKAAPPYPIEDPILAYERGVRDVGHLTASWMWHVERPHYTRSQPGRPWAGDVGRRRQAARMFPALVRGGATPPPPGGSLPPAEAPPIRPLLVRTAPAPAPGRVAPSPSPPLATDLWPPSLPESPALRAPSASDVVAAVGLVAAGAATVMVISKLRKRLVPALA